MRRSIMLLAATALSLSGPLAMAQQSGDTSGPATGQPVKPSAATQKVTSGGDAAAQGGTAAGAPGVEAKPGSESGAAPEKPKN